MELEKQIENESTMFSCNVTYYRKFKKLSQEQLAEKADLSRTIVSNIEAQGMETNPTLNTILRLAIALEIPAHKLLVFRE